MSGRRGLLSNSRRTAASTGSTAASSRGGAAAGPVQLPPYEPPSCPLDDAAKRALSEISLNRATTKKYEDHLKQSVQLLTTSIYGVNDRRKVRNDESEALAARRHEKGLEDKSEHEISTETASKALERDVPDLNIQIEAAVRGVIDRQAAFDDEKDVINGMVYQLRAQQPPQPQRRPRTSAADENGEPLDQEMMDTTEEETPILGAIDLLQKSRETSTAQYHKLTAFQKYAERNEYKTFKNNWHLAYHDDDGIPLPDASTWFDKDGEPAISQDSRGAAVDGDGDDDLVVEREVRSFKCPLTLRTMQEPYSSHVCKHSFEKAAIFEYLHRPQKCPQTGCNATLSKKDFFPDEAMLRRITRAEKAERNYAGQTSDIEADDEDGDASMIEAGSRNVKQEKAKRGRGRRVVEDIDE